MKVAVFGAGTMGAAIAALFANAGFDVVLVDKSESAIRKARERHEGECLRELEEAGLKKRDEIVSKILYTTEIEQIEGSLFIVEAVVEILNEKIELFKTLEDFVDKRCIFATNTSSFMPSEIAGDLRYPERLTLFHFSNPPILMPLIEVGGERVSDDVIRRTVEIARKIGKEPVILRKECRGHVLNRMFYAGWVAASYVLLYASPEEIDMSIRNLGSPTGFFELLDLIGLDILPYSYASFREAYGSRFELPKFMEFFTRKMVEWGKFGKKSGEGFYRWVEGKAVIPEAQPCDVMPIVAATVNEALRVVEDGVADEETVNRIYKLATNSPAGILDVAEMLGYGTVIRTLEEWYDKYGHEIFRTCESLRAKAKEF
jgi:enoyl-CoA hydratase/3-hydroxyacyl-CoA dehydrogenase